MNHYEEELQNNIEARNVSVNDADTKAYQHVFKSLKKEPEFTLPMGFADRVANMVAERNEKKIYTRDLIWLVVGVVFITIGFIIAIAVGGLKFDLSFLSGIAEYKGLIIFGVVFIGFLNWLDKKLLKDKHANV